MPTYFHRPDNALKRAYEFLEVGRKEDALKVLYDVLKSKNQAWKKVHELIIHKFLELCMELRKSRIAREGLYQYKSLCQQVNIKSFDDVVRSYLKLVEEKAEAAKGESKHLLLDIEDLDVIQTPESVLLSAVSGKDTQDRAERLRFIPWVKYLWETYRQCLDMLRNNSKVERLYHDVAQQAFKFCLMYNRKVELRRLCDNLHTHLEQIPHYYNQTTVINLNNPETQSMHLETRLVQLDHAISMELWMEAFKAIKDIHALFGLSKKLAKPQLMVSYYKKISTVFWKSDKLLFHACALHQHFHLSREMRKNITQDEIERMSTRVLLATLAIPITPERADIARLLGMNNVIVEKQNKLATLLGQKSPPTRQTLINDMVTLNILQCVAPEVKELYNVFEVDFHPLKLSERVTKVLNWVRDQAEEDSDLQQYIPRLESNTVLRLLQQVSQFYQRIELSRLATFVPFVNVFQLEHYIVDAARHCNLQIRIDHASRTVSFVSKPNYWTIEDAPAGYLQQNQPLDIIQNQLAAMSGYLAKAIQVIRPASIQKQHEEQKQLAIAAYLKNSHKNHQQILARRKTIQQRCKSLKVQQEKELIQLREDEMDKARIAEKEHRELEVKEREMKRIIEQHEQIKKKAVLERLEQLKKTEIGAKIFKNIRREDLEKLDPDTIMDKHVELLKKEKKELEERLKIKEKEFDHFVRAKHLDEVPLIKGASEEMEKVMNHILKLEHEKALENKRRLARMMEDKEIFLSRLTSPRNEEEIAYQEHLVEERQKRLEDRKRQRNEERRNVYYRQKEEEAAQRIHEEQLKQEQKERERERMEQKQREENERENLRKLEEQGQKQRARLQEIEERQQHREQERSAPPEEKHKEPVEKGGRWRSEGPRCGFDDARGPRRVFDDTRGPRRGFDDGRGPRHGFDDARGPRRGFDDERGPRSDMDEWRSARCRADDVWGPRRRGNDDRDGWRVKEEGPRRCDDNSKAQKPLDRPGGWREQEKAREDRCGP